VAAAVGRGIALELDPTRGLDGVEAPARARRPARAGREWGRGGDDGAVCRMEGGVAREEVEQVEAAAEDAVVGDEEHRVPYEAGTAGQVAAVEERHERRRARAAVRGTEETLFRRSAMDLVYGDACPPRLCWLRRARSCGATAATETLVSAIAEGQVDWMFLYDGT
jgi:hypothetical protein